jgi:hypothetical protein
MDLSELAIIVLQAVLPGLVAALTWASVRLASYIGRKVDSERLRGVLLRLDDFVISTVKALQQAVVEAIKEASFDGKITDEDRRRFKAAAIEQVKSYLGPKGLRELAKVLGLRPDALDGFLESRVEAAVHDVKLGEWVEVGR